jgi:hypothetical protein
MDHNQQGRRALKKPRHFFGRCLCELPLTSVSVRLRLDRPKVTLQVPPLLPCLLSKIHKSVDTLGIFRKDGSKLRQKKLEEWIEHHYSESLAVLPTSVLLDGRFTSDALIVYDYVAVLKDFLRGCPTGGLIPPHFKRALNRCVAKSPSSVEAMIILLLPKRNLHVLLYVPKVLSDAALMESDNRTNIEAFST